MNRPHTYTINCDLGEGVSNEHLIIPWIDVASVACGGHFGNKDSIKATLHLIEEFGKKAGAHPSYPDQENFGRKTLDISHNDLVISLKNQVNLFLEVADSMHTPIDHIKFHGALYNDAAEQQVLAELLADFLKGNFPDTPLFVPPHSELEKAAVKCGLPFRLEIFGDRAYLPNYRLVGRNQTNSLLTQPEPVISHLESILLLGQIKTYSGELIPIETDTLCFHGDNPGILEFLPKIRREFWSNPSSFGE